jgi:hypothetical protein
MKKGVLPKSETLINAEREYERIGKQTVTFVLAGLAFIVALIWTLVAISSQEPTYCPEVAAVYAETLVGPSCPEVQQ